MSARLNIIVEGQTEEAFVGQLLEERFAFKGIYIKKRAIETSRVRERSIRLGQKTFKIYRGGISTYSKAKRDIKAWLREDKGAYLTTMFDLYALPEDFPNFEAALDKPNPYEKVKLIEKGLAEDINDGRFIPYIQLHEFEGLLFSDVKSIDNICNIYSKSRLRDLQKIREQFDTPEEIDNGPLTAPSKRLMNIYDCYEKVAFGIIIAKQIGLDLMMSECPHFREWIISISSLGSEADDAAQILEVTSTIDR